MGTPTTRMRRRTLLLSVGGIAALGGAGLRPGADEGPIQVRIWTSERAVAYPGVRERAGGYVERALEAAGRRAAVSFGEPAISLPSEDDLAVYTRTWPRMVFEGVAGRGPVDPVPDVNLLLTDGDPRRQPAGYGTYNAAVVGGASYLAEAEGIDRDSTVVSYSLTAAVVQLLLHECGHALGLEHGHGSVTVEDDAAIASPMVGSYAWAPEAVRRRQFDYESDVCGGAYPSTDGRERRLSLRYSSCASRALSEYSGRVFR